VQVRGEGDRAVRAGFGRVNDPPLQNNVAEFLIKADSVGDAVGFGAAEELG
jgi:hypothetical protein